MHYFWNIGGKLWIQGFLTDTQLLDHFLNRNFISDIEIIVPNKVVKIYFLGNMDYEKMVCSDEDTFDLERCCYLALAKHFYREDYTMEGIEWLATYHLPFLKDWNICVKNALKNFYRKEEEKRKEEEDQKEKERIAERKRQKKIAYKKRREEQAKVQRAKALSDEYTIAINTLYKELSKRGFVGSKGDRCLDF